MDDSVAVGEARGFEHLADQQHRVFDAEPGVDQLLQRVPFEHLHRDVEGSFDLAAVVDGDDVRVLEAGRGFGLAAEALDEFAVLGEMPVQDLERDSALKVGVLGEPDVGHPAGADFLQQAVARVENAVLAYLRGHSTLLFFLAQQGFRDFAKIGAATSPPKAPVHSIETAIAIFGSSAGAKPMNQA